MKNCKYVFCKNDNWENQYFENMVFIVKEVDKTNNSIVIIDKTEENQEIELHGNYVDFVEINKDEYEEIINLLDDDYSKKFPQYINAIEKLTDKYLKY